MEFLNFKLWELVKQIEEDEDTTLAETKATLLLNYGEKGTIKKDLISIQDSLVQMVVRVLSSYINKDYDTKNITIDIDETDMELKTALMMMTDQWIDEGQYSDQTVFDLRNALKKLVL